MIGISDFGLAYRKAKVDLYYSSNPSLGKISNYEENIDINLNRLFDLFNREDELWVESLDFLGGWTLNPKSVNTKFGKSQNNINDSGLIFSSHADFWEKTCEILKIEKKKPDAEFRVMADCSIDFHVLSTLWMLNVGHVFDKNLTDCAKGNRLRRTKNGKSINKLSLGTFSSYLKPFRDWRDNAIKSMRNAIDNNQKIVAITADVSSFYHKIDANFLIDLKFLEETLRVKLTSEQAKLNRLFVRALQAWAANSPLKYGLPVGLPASAVVANVALVELDRMIERRVVPLYYGRYVDDIILVMENGANFRSKVELWEWLFSRSEGMLSWTDPEEKGQISFKPSYTQGRDNRTEIQFSNSKNKVFIMSGESGRALVDAIDHQIRERASEWRAMPRLPQSVDYVGTDLLAATQSDGEVADNLRKADALTMRRAGFAIRLRDLEAYERDLLPDAWREHRHAFFRAFIQYVLVLPKFFDLAIYLPRVIRLATACEDFEYLKKLIDQIDFIYGKIVNDCSVSIKSISSDNPINENIIIDKWRKQITNIIVDSVISAIPPIVSSDGFVLWRKHIESNYLLFKAPSFWDRSIYPWPLPIREIQKTQEQWFSFDLAHIPFRFIGMPKEMVAQRGIPKKSTIIMIGAVDALLPSSLQRGIKKLTEWLGFKGVPHGLIFATRPLNLPELYIVNRKFYSDQNLDSMRDVVLSIRGFTINEKMPCFDKNHVLRIPDGEASKCGIAVSSWKTRIDSWVAAVTKSSDPDLDRYARLNRLLDSVIAHPEHSRYLILPELALPAHWFIRIARKLHGRGISLITGIEYLHAKKSRVSNQVWASLTHVGLGFPSFMIYRQDKQRPALHEELELQRLSGLKLSPDKKWDVPPVIQHGGFRFSILVCSELTNISYRAALRGQIDALFVPEWNQDTETFNALVESAALDVHAYVIQCNDRQYGDSRIRAPFKDSWKRDILRVKGGVIDYCVIGEIDVISLRKFQSSHRSSMNLFKPVPDGFKINDERWVLPLEE